MCQVIPINQLRVAVKRTEQAKALEERGMLQERLKTAERHIQRLEGALQRVMQGVV